MMFHRNTLLVVLAGLMAVACAPKISERTRIHGRFEGGTGDKVSLYVMDDHIQNEPIELVDNAFSFELPTRPAIVATLSGYMNGERLSQAFIPDGSELTIVFTPDGASLTSSNKRSLNYRMQTVDRTHDELMELLFQRRKMLKAGADQAKLDSLDTVIAPVREKLTSLYREHIETQKNNYLAAEGILRIDLPDEQKDSIINTLDSSVVQTARIQWLHESIKSRQQSREGMPFVDFSVETETGTVHLSDYVGKGKYILADFWASWCSPCIQSMPHLKEVYQKYNGPDFTILGITVDDPPARSQAAIKEYGLPWPQILGTGSVAMDVYGIEGIPHLILFGPDGTILRRGLHGKALDKALEQVLGK